MNGKSGNLSHDPEKVCIFKCLGLDFRHFSDTTFYIFHPLDKDLVMGILKYSSS